MNKINNPHDKFFRELMGDKEKAKDFLVNFLPKKILQLINLEKIKIVKDSFVDEELKEYFSDILYRVDLDGKKGYIYFLLEHKSYPYKVTSFQLLKYMVQIWGLHLKQKPKEKLPVIVPLVFYHGQETWSIDKKLSSLIVPVSEELKPYIPNFEYELCDLSTYSDEEIKGLVMFEMGMLILKHISHKNFETKLNKILALYKNLQEKERGMDFIQALIHYVLNASEIPVEHLKEIVETQISKEEGEKIMTTAEKLIEQGVEQGLEQGIEQGLQEGIIENLEVRFGFISEEMRSKIKKVENIEQLKKYHKESILVKSLEGFSL
ncbi:hypothetical protein MNBD_GAMMA03-1551 [hydrothermal vent metagenome]|uniref:Transposase (putative) YhgA-like domain-containing protein n=1 Tax=hydrothermal vent metagenome TaxID=652676 RepID=A0A3B0VVW1_9ZZZZ